MAVTMTTSVAVRARPAADPPSARVLAATIRCLGRWGLAKTTLDDIGREAGLSRATVYRLFPGGKDVVVRAAVLAELGMLQDRMTARLTGIVDLEELLVTVITEATRSVRDHRVLQFVLAHEPEHVLPHLSFAGFDRVLAGAGQVLGPWLEPHLGEDARRAAEWVCRLVLSYVLAPSQWFDLAEVDDARRFTRTFLLPGLRKVT